MFGVLGFSAQSAQGHRRAKKRKKKKKKKLNEKSVPKSTVFSGRRRGGSDLQVAYTFESSRSSAKSES